MKLYYSPGACSLAPHIVLRETELPFTLERVDTAKHTLASGGDYYAINPKGMVPVLELDDGERLTEGPVIAQYLADKAGNTQLMPAAGSLARYRVMEWQNYITSELHKSFSPLFTPDFDAAAKALQSKLLRKKFEWVDGKLANGSFLTGE
ncbi:MAG TPA: glutathione S-transferase N-terminal domain-containing protein, partial [Rubrivivax sp.]|nr:glutathione S-transferase N-terminal domain-containing protein [Rubrivivax sp.]